jgi:hypothetical protein
MELRQQRVWPWRLAEEVEEMGYVWQLDGEEDKARPMSPVMQRPEPVIEMDAMAFGMGCCCVQVGALLPSEREGDGPLDRLAPFYDVRSPSRLGILTSHGESDKPDSYSAQMIYPLYTHGCG